MAYFLLDTLSSVISSTNYFILSFNVDYRTNFIAQACLITYYLNVHTLLAAFSIIYLKNSQDIINDVNKLEELCRVSQFQRYTHDICGLRTTIITQQNSK